MITSSWRGRSWRAETRLRALLFDRMRAFPAILVGWQQSFETPDECLRRDVGTTKWAARGPPRKSVQKACLPPVTVIAIPAAVLVVFVPLPALMPPIGPVIHGTIHDRPRAEVRTRVNIHGPGHRADDRIRIIGVHGARIDGRSHGHTNRDAGVGLRGTRDSQDHRQSDPRK